jgi:hypothetical protein
MKKSMFVSKSPLPEGRAFQTLEKIDLELNLGQISFKPGKIFQLTLDRYVSGKREYEISLRSPLGFYYTFKEGPIFDVKMSREKFEELDKCLFYGGKVVISDERTFDVI